MSTAEVVVAVLFVLIVVAGVWVAHGLTKDLRRLIVLLLGVPLDKPP
jgi:hypothetical protein